MPSKQARCAVLHGGTGRRLFAFCWDRSFLECPTWGRGGYSLLAVIGRAEARSEAHRDIDECRIMGTSVTHGDGVRAS